MARPLRPTLKERKRYVVYQPADDTAVMQDYAMLFGTVGAAKAGIRGVEQKGARSILKVNNTNTDHLKAAIVWGGRSSVTTTGALKKARIACEE